MKLVELDPIEEPQEGYDILEKRLKEFFKKVLYIPLLKEMELPKKVLLNAPPNALTEALMSGQITYIDGEFVGKFNAAISKELHLLGASFDSKKGSFKLRISYVPYAIRQAILSGEDRFKQRLKDLDRKLKSMVPEELADQFKCEDVFDRTLFRADKSFQKNVKKLVLTPTLTPGDREKISKEWQNNMRLYIKDWTEEQIKKLRAQVYEQIVTQGSREKLIAPILKITKTIQGSHDEALNKAKFLAHQESRMLMAKFKEVRYTGAGIPEYLWRCVHRPFDASPNQHIKGNVRYAHGLLNGKIFRWDDPPITSNPGEPTRRNNPGTDYNCRCIARPILRK